MQIYWNSYLVKKMLLFYFIASINLIFSLESQFYIWKNNWRVHYVKEGNHGPPILLIPGFGVGTFHYEKNINELCKDHQVYSLDLFGQGKSWPVGDVLESDNLCYSVDLWRDQISFFIENIVKEPVHIAGNSLGGYLSVSTTFTYPDLIESLTAINPTPFWAFAPPTTSKSYLPWNGVLPAPEPIYKFGSSYFDLMKDPKTISTMLKSVYTDHNAIDEKLIQNIITSASDPGGHAAFTSILFSPKSATPFDTMLASIHRPLCLIYGKEDPWITPLWGQRAKRIVPDATYIELSPTGHCPHHESPNTVNKILKYWIQESKTKKKDLSNSNSISNSLYNLIGEHDEDNDRKVELSIVDGKPRNFVEKVAEYVHVNWELNKINTSTFNSDTSN